MRFQIYRDGELVAVCEYGQEPIYHGALGEIVRDAIEASREVPVWDSATLANVPSQWLHWASSIVYPVLASGALVRWYA